MSTSDIQKTIYDFVNNKIYGFVISTNLKQNYQHETFILGYTFKDLINGRYSEFWSKLGGYKESIILFPNCDLEIVSKNKEITQTIKLYKTVKALEMYVEKCKNEKSHPAPRNPGTIDEDYYDPEHMYMRYYSFGTPVKESELSEYWHVKINGISADGFTVRDTVFMRQFGTVIKFDTLANIIKRMTNQNINENINTDEKQDFKDNINENEDKLKSQLETLQLKLEKLENEKNEKNKELNTFIALNELLETQNKNLKTDLKNTEEKYVIALNEERKIRKIEVKREQTITKRITKEFKALNEKYEKDIINYENQIHNLKKISKENNIDSSENSSGNVENKITEKPIKIIKSKEKNIWFDIILIIMILSILINITQYIYKIYDIEY